MNLPTRYVAVCAGCGTSHTLSPVTGDEAQQFLDQHLHCRSIVTMRALRLLPAAA